jgi:RimJ/RimL family protein N-acetyltransferase
MTDVPTSRLRLHAIDAAEGERIVARTAGPTDAWADDFPFEGDVDAVGSFLRATATHGEQRPFGFYRITRLSDERAIGGIGFKGQPIGGTAEIGYGLAPSARGQGYAAEAVMALLSMAADHGLIRMIADTTLDNIASQRTLTRAGFRLVRTDAELHHYEVLLNGSTAWSAAFLRSPRRILEATLAASVLGGTPSLLNALAHGGGRGAWRYGLDATRAIGSLAPPGRRSIVAGAGAHAAISLVAGQAFGRFLPRRHSILWAAGGGAVMGLVGVGIIGRRFPAIRELALGPQIADNIAFGVIFAVVADRRGNP